MRRYTDKIRSVFSLSYDLSWSGFLESVYVDIYLNIDDLCESWEFCRCFTEIRTVTLLNKEAS